MLKLINFKRFMLKIKYFWVLQKYSPCSFKKSSFIKMFLAEFMTEYYFLKIFFTKWRKLGPKKNSLGMSADHWSYLIWFCQIWLLKKIKYISSILLHFWELEPLYNLGIIFIEEFKIWQPKISKNTYFSHNWYTNSPIHKENYHCTIMAIENLRFSPLWNHTHWGFSKSTKI